MKMIRIIGNLQQRGCPMNRRSFFQTALTAIGAVAILPVIAKAQKTRGGGAPAGGTGPVMADPNGQQEKAIKYIVKSDKKDQTCANCVLYNMDNKETTHAGKKIGSCTLIPGKMVHAEGWCQSWAKKP